MLRDSLVYPNDKQKITGVSQINSMKLLQKCSVPARLRFPSHLGKVSPSDYARNLMRRAIIALAREMIVKIKRRNGARLGTRIKISGHDSPFAYERNAAKRR